MPDSQPNKTSLGRPTMCRNCGAIVGGGEDQCAVCGASVENLPSSQRRTGVADRETIRFARAVLGRPHKFTIILLVVNFFVFLLMWESSGMTMRALWEFPEPVLLAYGAKLNTLIKLQHQWWRFVTPMFIHVNLPHVLVNMYSLWVVGPYVEKLYGSAKFVVLWVLTGMAGVVASYLTVVDPHTSMGWLGRFLFKTQDVPSAGASGALFGLVGVLFVFGIKFRHELPEGFKRAFGTGMLPIIVINLFIGYLGRGFIDNAAHIGGLVSGAALALVVQYRRPGERASITASWYVMEVVSIGIVAFSFFEVVNHFRDPIPLSASVQVEQPVDDKTAAFLSYSKAINEAHEALNSAMNGDPSTVDQALRNLELAPPLDEKSDELRQRLAGLLIQAKDRGATRSSSDQRAKGVGQKPNQLAEEFNAWKNEYNQWLKSVGDKYAGR